jgi:hypothetical protein
MPTNEQPTLVNASNSNICRGIPTDAEQKYPRIIFVVVTVSSSHTYQKQLISEAHQPKHLIKMITLDVWTNSNRY